MEPIFDLFSIYIFIIPNMNKIMQNPNMKIIPIEWPILVNHFIVILLNNLIQQRYVILWNGWFGLESERFLNQYGLMELN